MAHTNHRAISVRWVYSLNRPSAPDPVNEVRRRRVHSSSSLIYPMAGHVDWTLFTLSELKRTAQLIWVIDTRPVKTKEKMIKILIGEEKKMETVLEVLFNKHVPSSGPATSRIGKLLRAIFFFVHRYFNDGDSLAECMEMSPERFKDAERDQGLWQPLLDIQRIRNGAEGDSKRQHRDFIRVLSMLHCTQSFVTRADIVDGV